MLILQKRKAKVTAFQRQRQYCNLNIHDVIDNWTHKLNCLVQVAGKLSLIFRYNYSTEQTVACGM